MIYKQETEESQLIKKGLDKLVEANFLSALLPFVKTKLIHNETTVGMFMSLD